MGNKKRVLFLCTGNSCRSQMAEGLVNFYLGDSWQANSAGTQPTGYIHPLAISAMNELGIDISKGQSRSVDTVADGTYDIVVTVCDGAAEDCPVWLRGGKVIHHAFVDPARATGSEEEQLKLFRQVRNEIRAWVIPYLNGD